jgi:hypothetical protein
MLGRGLAVCCIALMITATAAAGDSDECRRGDTVACVGVLPTNLIGAVSSSYLGARACVADARGSTHLGPCARVRCEGRVVYPCTTTTGEPGLAQCQDVYDVDAERSDGSSVSACALPKECKPYETSTCASLRVDGPPRPISCVTDDGAWQFPSCDTPIVLSFDGRAVAFVSVDGEFAIGHDTHTWVDASTPWLAADFDGDGAIDDETELFGTATEHHAYANGFDALASFDDDHDGAITPRDGVWPMLRVWRDVDQNRRSSPDELATLADNHVVSLALDYVAASEGEVGAFTIDVGSKAKGRLVDVHIGAR